MLTSKRITGIAIAMLAVGAAIITIAASPLGGSNGTARAAAPVTTERLAAGPYTLAITRQGEAGAERADVLVTDHGGAPAVGKPLTGLLSYEGNAPGHEHHDILVSREPQPGHYVLDLREVVPGPWLLTVVIGDEARVAYVFNVQ